jgi:pyrroline-5-carboxylate reductase
MNMDLAPLGIFGAGHLGRAIALALLDAGWPRAALMLCHSGSAATEAALAAAGLSDCVVSPERLAAESKLVFYLVRPQNAEAIAGLAMHPDALLVSFLAGIDLDRLPPVARVRAMISDPDTLAKKNGIAALYPRHDAVDALLTSLGLRVLQLPSEQSFAAFTALGPCLPMAAAWCLGHGAPIDRGSLYALGREQDLSGYPDIVDWALDVCPKDLSPAALEDYLAHAATPGGVTEAVIKGLEAGDPIAAALLRGVRRCEELARG